MANKAALKKAAEAAEKPEKATAVKKTAAKKPTVKKAATKKAAVKEPDPEKATAVKEPEKATAVKEPEKVQEPERPSQIDQVIPEEPPKKREKKEEINKLVLNFGGKNRNGEVNDDRKRYLQIMSEKVGTKMTPYILQLIDDDMRRNAKIYAAEKKEKISALLDEIQKYR